MKKTFKTKKLNRKVLMAAPLGAGLATALAGATPASAICAPRNPCAAKKTFGSQKAGNPCSPCAAANPCAPKAKGNFSFND